MKKLLFTVSLLVLAVTLNAQLKAFTIQAPEKPLPGVQKISIMKFQNSGNNNYNYWYQDAYGDNFPNYMTTELLNEDRGAIAFGKAFKPDVKMNQFIIVERSQLDNIIKEQQLGASGAVDDNQAAQVGKLLGLDAIISGTYKYTNAGDQSSTKPVKNKDGAIVRYIHSYTRTVIVEATMKVISIETGQIIAVTTKSKTMVSKKSNAVKNKAYQALTSVEILRDNGIKGVATMLTNFIAPTFRMLNYDLEKIKVKAYKDRAKDAVSAAKEGEIAQALGIYQAIFKEDTYNARLAYNLGLTYEAVLDYDKAIEMHKTATGIDDNKQYKSALERAETGKETIAALKAQGWKIGTEDLSAASGEGISAEVVEKIKTKGSVKDRVKVYSEPMKQGEVAAQVPGGMEMVVTGKEGPFIKVKLVNGSEGYIHQDDTK